MGRAVKPSFCIGDYCLTRSGCEASGICDKARLPARAIPGVPACWWKHPPHAYKPHIRPMRIDRWRGWHVFIEGRNFYLSTFALVGDLFRAHTLGLLEGLELEYEEELPDLLRAFRRQGLDLVLA